MPFMSLLNDFRSWWTSKIQVKEERAILLVCMGIALVFWLLVKLSKPYNSEKDVLFFFILPEDKAFSDSPPKKYSVEIRGTGWDLMYEYFTNPKTLLYYDLNQTDQLTLNQTRLRSDINRNLSSRDLEISEFSHDGFTVTLEEKIEKKVPIRLSNSGDITFGKGYHLQSPLVLNPDSIFVSGPKSMVEGIEEWQADSLTAHSLRSSLVKKVPLFAPAEEITLSHRLTEVLVPVEQYTENSFRVPIQIQNIPDSLVRITPEQVTLTFFVGLSKYDQVDTSDFVLEVDFAGLRERTNKNTVPITLTEYPPFVRNVLFYPKSVEFLFVKPPEENLNSD